MLTQLIIGMPIVLLAIVAFTFNADTENRTQVRGVNNESTMAQVVEVIDGDTFKVEIDNQLESVRLVGVDAPELTRNECYAQQSRDVLFQLVDSQTVYLTVDSEQSDRDAYGRLLAYVATESVEDVGLELLSLGSVATFDTFYEQKTRYEDARRDAATNGVGLWGNACQVAENCNCRRCKFISSCEEAQYLTNICGCEGLDGDSDGIACESGELGC